MKMVVIRTTRDRAEHLLAAVLWLREQHYGIASSGAYQSFDRHAHRQCMEMLGMISIDIGDALGEDEVSKKEGT